MRVRFSDREPADGHADLAVYFCFEGDKAPRGVADRALSRELAARMRADRFQGRKGDRLVWNVERGGESQRLLIVGLGAGNGAAGEALRWGSAVATKRSSEFSARSLALKVPRPAAGGDLETEVRAAVEGALLGAYRYDRHLTEPTRKETRLERIEVAADEQTAALKRAAARGEIAAHAVWLARDLVNEGPSSLTPTAFARRATQEAKRAGLSVKVLGPAEIKKIGMKALLAVARGSEEPARVVHLIYRPKAKKPRKRIALIGKGVTFDSGGLNLKPGESMRTMKCDMAGAAAVLGAMTALKDVGCRVEVHALLGLVENMTGGAAYKPGDILATLDGKTVEVGNTDAEGRLVMCDLLTHAARGLRPDEMLDVATLTGACVVALGMLASGAFSRHEDLREAVLAAGARGGEKLWPMPMYDEYLQLLQKGPADLCNVGGRWAGAITAALFLGEFVPRSIPWLHLDIAGPAFAENDSPETPEGGTGAGVRTLIRWLETA